MFTGGNRQSKQRFRRQRIHLSRIFVTNDGKQIEPNLDSKFLGQYRTMIVVQPRRRIFRQTIQIKAARVTPLPTKFVKYDGIEASICAAKPLADNCAVLS